MLAPSDLLAWFQRLDIPEPTHTIISHIRSSGPSRRVGGGNSNVSGRYRRSAQNRQARIERRATSFTLFLVGLMVL